VETARPDAFDQTHVEPPPLADGPFRLGAIALDVSGRCNLACRYCAEAATQPARPAMSEETLRAAWRLLCPDGEPRAGTSIRLGSGEPLLAFPLLRRLQELIKRHGGSPAEGRPDVFLTTNGTLVGKRVRDWLVASGWHVKLSLDGPREVHDRWRVDSGGRGTWRRVSAAAAELAARMPERFSVTAVLCRGADPGEVFHRIAALGVDRIELVPVAHENPDVVPGGADLESYRRFVEGYAEQVARDVDNRVPTLVRFENSLRRVMGYDLCRVPCGAGRTFLGVDASGDLYPCFRFFGIRGYRLGRLPEGENVRRTADFRRQAGRPYEERADCRACWAAPLCGGPCFACAETFGKGSGVPLESHCAYVRADAAAAVALVERLREEAPERLLRFLPGSLGAFEALA
jgi:uncharacterized protein